jgi:quercetin dioxygenase-like cupin family protein
MTNVRTGLHRGVALIGLTVGASMLAASAYAGTCPPDKQRADGSGEKVNAAPASGVSDSVLASIDLAREPAMLKDRLLRLRRLEIQPGGVVPWHQHANRPAIIYMIQGEIVEYASTCAVPIVHQAGDVAVETHATSHWWKNLGKETVVLLSADLFPVATSNQHMT